MKRFLFAVVVFLIAAHTAQAGNWPAWRGPNGNGVADEKGLPISWSADENIKWKVSLPGPGNSTPIVWGDRIFLTGALDAGARRTLMCFDRANGKKLWQEELTCDAKEVTHKTNPYCASSPVTDGKSVFVWHGSAGVAAYDFNGKRLWHQDVGEFTHIWGYASSPVLVDDLVIVSCGPGLRALLVAFDKKTGRQVWKRDLPAAQSKEAKQFKGSWGTPVLRIDKDGNKQLVLGLPKQLIGFDPKTGKDIWTCRGLTDLVYTDSLISGDVVVAMSGYHGAALACRVGRGDVTESGRLWLHAKKNPQRIGSGVVVDGHVYLLNEPGIAWCIEVQTGKIKWKERLSSKRSWCSMSYVDGRLYVPNENGETFILRPNPEKLDLIATNRLDGEVTRGSPAFSDGQIFMRSHKHLYCIEESKK